MLCGMGPAARSERKSVRHGGRREGRAALTLRPPGNGAVASSFAVAPEHIGPGVAPVCGPGTGHALIATAAPRRQWTPDRATGAARPGTWRQRGSSRGGASGHHTHQAAPASRGSTAAVSAAEGLPADGPPLHRALLGGWRWQAGAPGSPDCRRASRLASANSIESLGRNHDAYSPLKLPKMKREPIGRRDKERGRREETVPSRPSRRTDDNGQLV